MEGAAGSLSVDLADSLLEDASIKITMGAGNVTLIRK